MQVIIISFLLAHWIIGYLFANVGILFLSYELILKKDEGGKGVLVTQTWSMPSRVTLWASVHPVSSQMANLLVFVADTLGRWRLHLAYHRSCSEKILATNSHQVASGTKTCVCGEKILLSYIWLLQLLRNLPSGSVLVVNLFWPEPLT